MRPKIPLKPGDVFNKWTVISDPFLKQPRKSAYVKCRCECGEIREINSSAVKRGDTRQCGGCRRSNYKPPIRQIRLTPEQVAFAASIKRKSQDV